ncbi:DUF685 domain-containing protein (plasmid) [Borrelia miyamotoi]|uniref:DUF685 domain-containing protein n=1 Tax=Borrelia miyamotoi TaxID=47466 RepID=A0A5P8ARX9_9SPIR|nr:DUF685 domain-containing protein [Borrelia miyamotoi]
MIKGIIATELLQDDTFISQVYNKILTKFLNNDSSSISSTYSKVKNKLGSSLSTYKIITLLNQVTALFNAHKYLST